MKKGMCTVMAAATASFLLAAEASAVGCLGDFDGNHVVDGADLAVLLGGWGATAGDLDGDGTTDGADLAVLLGAWGPCPIGICGASANDCCVASPFSTPFCGDEFCCQTVCAIDPFCCSSAWDTVCAGQAVGLCAALCGDCGASANDCCLPSPNGAPFCSDELCCVVVCAADPFCCTTAWDAECAEAAQKYCAVCAPPCSFSKNDCCEPSPDGTPACSDETCCEAICAADPFCCNTAWDEVCAEQAEAQCAVCQDPCAVSVNDCCAASSTPGCNDAACCEAICAVDPFCCNNAWDLACANQAEAQCAVCQGVCSTSSNSCCVANSTPGCADTACCEAICAVDPFCCNNAWDFVCAAQAVDQCAVCAQPSNCCEAGVQLGCDDPVCEATVCGADPFCCQVQWDQLCANAALAQCGVCQ